VAEFVLNVEARTDTGKGVARKLRAGGRIPGICYGASEPQSIALDPHALDRLIRGSASGINTLIDLKVDGGGVFDGKKVLVKEVQRDPVTNEALHADLFAIDMTHTLEVAVPVHVKGIPIGVSMDEGILDHVLREIDIECLPHAIPDEIIIDVSMLEIGMSIHVRDLTLPAGVELRTDEDLSVVSVVAPKAIEEELPVADADADADAVEGEAEAGDKASPDGDGEGPGEKKADD